MTRSVAVARTCHGEGVALDADTLRLLIPLTPSRNEVDAWHLTRNFRKLAAYKRAAQLGVASAVNVALGCDRPRPWAEAIVLSIVRCSDQRRRLDRDNVAGGCKAALDALVTASLIVDDAHDRVRWGGVEDRLPAAWGDFSGPGTHLLIRRESP